MGAPVVALVMVSSNSFHSFESIRTLAVKTKPPPCLEPPEQFPAVLSARYCWIACEEVGRQCPRRTPPSTDEIPNGVSAFDAPTTDDPETHGGNPASCLTGATGTIPSGIQCSILADGLRGS